MNARRTILLGGAVAAAMLCGCRNPDTKRAIQQSQLVAEDSRKAVRIPDHCTQAEARAAMGRDPDEVRRDGDYVIHYYLVRGAVEGEALRLVFRDDRLVSRSVIKTNPQ